LGKNTYLEDYYFLLEKLNPMTLRHAWRAWNIIISI